MINYQHFKVTFKGTYADVHREVDFLVELERRANERDAGSS